MTTKHYVHNIRAVDLNLLGVFDAIYKERNITRAAKRLGMSQPAVSGALTRLRQLTDDQLFVKTSQGMDPTSCADELSEPIAEALDTILSALNQHVEFDYANTTHNFCLAMSDYSEFVMLPSLMRWLRKNAPNISISTVPVVEETLLADLESGAVDLAIGYIPSLETGCYRQRLVFEELVSVVRKDHREIGDKLTVAEFETIPHVTFTPRLGEKHIERVLEIQSVIRKVALRLPNYLSIVGVVTETDFIGVLPLRIVERLNNLMPLRIVESPVQYPGVSVDQHWHTKKHKNPGNSWLRHLLKELASEL